MVVGEHGIQTFEVVIVVSLDVSIHKCTSLIIFGQVVCLNILKCHLNLCVVIDVIFDYFSTHSQVDYCNDHKCIDICMQLMKNIQ